MRDNNLIRSGGTSKENLCFCTTPSATHRHFIGSLKHQKKILICFIIFFRDTWGFGVLLSLITSSKRSYWGEGDNESL